VAQTERKKDQVLLPQIKLKKLKFNKSV